MKRLILIACAGLSMSCTSIKIAAKETRPVPKTNQPQRVITTEKLSRNSTADAYIERYKDIAIEEMLKSGIPASITLAQGLLESANGNSTLATQANNHFGIKCNVDWTGPTILKDDDAIGECFRVYNNPEESYRDHSEFLKRKRYAALFELDRNDYRGWAHGLKKAGYATNPRYAELLIGLVERYQLDQYDRAETYIAKEQREERVLSEIIKEEPVKQINQPEKAPVAMKIYEVRQGDTLYSISRRFGISVDDVKILNSINGDDIKLGQLLLVSK
ncbi:glucosaminidase domain-containing protein [Pedobacter sp. SYSU D00535]|uniref:glucosaminidase domain-containing protein n=1 Tax=Pedobacter sp. SYSU D00535 TaxID=2810308 RepID=UPI001A97C9A1|nr:glucosaminidase domain-containing protein [Pedobacter sp. SYSU D00535]